jgi:hypothetical protein
MDLRETWWEVMDWMDLALVYTVTNLHVPWKVGNYLRYCRLSHCALIMNVM